MLDDEALKTAIHATVARQILEGLGTEARDALIVQSMTKVLTDYRFLSAVNEVVSDKAKRVAAELVESEDWDGRIRTTIRAGFDDYLVSLRMATTEMLKESMHGREGTYGSPGRVLGHWPKPSGDPPR